MILDDDNAATSSLLYFERHNNAYSIVRTMRKMVYRLGIKLKSLIDLVQKSNYMSLIILVPIFATASSVLYL